MFISFQGHCIDNVWPLNLKFINVMSKKAGQQNDTDVKGERSFFSFLTHSLSLHKLNMLALLYSI